MKGSGDSEWVWVIAPFHWFLLKCFLPTDTSRYCTLHCTGYMRSWPSSQTDSEGDAEKEASNLTCLVTMCRIQAHTSHQTPKDIKTKPLEFVTRCTIDGKFTFVDQQWVSLILPTCRSTIYLFRREFLRERRVPSEKVKGACHGEEASEHSARVC